jgi:serine/threonine protein phosphatase PrpC
MSAGDLSTVRGLALSSAYVTHIGDRQSNQDAQASAQEDDLACFVVSDGAGGHAGGEIASAIVVKAVTDSFLRELSFGVRALEFYVRNAIAQVVHGKEMDSRYMDMSATVAAILIDKENRQALWAHLGDTRIYLFRDRRLHNVTRDHSLVQQFVDAGYCPPEALRTHPQRSVLYAAIGTEGEVEPEVLQKSMPLRHGDAFLICTDGFWEWITENDMEGTLAAANTVDQWLRQMHDIVEINGKNSPKYRDNYTAQAIWFTDPESVPL